jgi:hypothetical protein
MGTPNDEPERPPLTVIGDIQLVSGRPGLTILRVAPDLTFSMTPTAMTSSTAAPRRVWGSSGAQRDPSICRRPLRRRGGDDYPSSGTGDGDLLGGDDDDYLVGSDGEDNLSGEEDEDVMIGGSDADTFTSAKISIRDFDRKEDDVIDVSAIDAIPGGGDNDFDYIGDGKFTAKGQMSFKKKTLVQHRQRQAGRSGDDCQHQQAQGRRLRALSRLALGF